MTQRSTIPLTDFLFRKAGAAQIPFSGTFELSPVCNFSCKMCYVRKTAQEVRSSPRPPMTLENWLEIAKVGRDAGMLYVLLTGGEPLLWPHFWELYEQLIDMGMLVSINTNGSLIDEEAVARFRCRPPRRINLTVYGAGDETYEALCGAKHVFSRVDRAVDLLRQAQIPLKLNCSLTPQNAADLEKIVAYSKEKQLILQVADYMFPPVRRDETMVGRNERFTPQEAAHYRMEAYRLQFGQEAYEAWLEKIRGGSILPPGLDESCVDPMDGKIRCRAGKSSFWITWDGWLTPCGMMTRPRIDLHGRNFMEAWLELFGVCRELQTSGICAKCPDFELCHACAAMALAETGSHSEVPLYLCQVIGELKKAAGCG